MIPTTAIWKQPEKSSSNMSMMWNEVTLSQTNQSNVCNVCYFEVAISGIKLFFKIWDKGGRFGGAVGAFRGPFSHPFPCPHQCKSHTAIPSTTTRAHTEKWHFLSKDLHQTYQHTVFYWLQCFCLQGPWLGPHSVSSVSGHEPHQQLFNARTKSAIIFTEVTNALINLIDI